MPRLSFTVTMEKHESSEAIMNILTNWGLPLPPDIVWLIFSKLSIFNLPACRCVNKSWNHLVLDYAASCPKFHLPNIAIIITNNNWQRNPKIYCLDFDTLSFVATNTLVGSVVRDIGVYNCCNGLLIIGNHIYNLMTHEYFPIPWISPSEFRYPVCSGFGFSPKTKQYKMVKAVTKSTCELKILRFGSNDNRWNSFYLSSPIHLYSHGVYMNGVIYWTGKQNIIECVIYAFDVETENFDVIGIFKSRPDQIWRLQPFNGTIYAIVTTKNPRSHIHLWRMQDKNFWIRDFIVPSNFSNYRDAAAVHLLKASEDGKILVQIERELFWLTSGKKIGNKEKIKTLFSPEIIDYSVCPVESLHFGSPLHFGSLPRILAGDD